MKPTHLERLVAAVARELDLTPAQLLDAVEAAVTALEHDAIARATAPATSWENEDTQPVATVWVGESES